MHFVDTHSHLYLSAFDEDRETVVENSFKNSITKILLPNIDSSSIEDMLNLSEKYKKNCFPMFGLHPTSVKSDYKNEISRRGVDLYLNYNISAVKLRTFDEVVLRGFPCVRLESHVRRDPPELERGGRGCGASGWALLLLRGHRAVLCGARRRAWQAGDGETHELPRL